MNLYALSVQASNENSIKILTPTSDKAFISSFLFNLLFIFPAIVLILGIYITNKKLKKIENTSKGVSILSFFIPIVGIILYFVKNNENEKIAKYYLKMAVAGIITYIFMILSFCLAFAIRFLFPLYILNW